MLPKKMKGMTREFGKPVDWCEEIDTPCMTLPIKDEMEAYSNVMVSHWVPDEQELAVLNAGGCVKLGIFGTGHPVVYVSTAEKES